MARQYDVRGEEPSIDLGDGYKVRNRGFYGQIHRHEGDEVHRGSLGGASAAVQRALEANHVWETQSLEFDLERPFEDGEITRSLGHDSVTEQTVVDLEVPTPPPEHGQIILAVDEDGTLSWHLPTSGIDFERTRGGTKTSHYSIPCQVTQGLEQSRTVLGVVNRMLLKVLVFPWSDPLLGTLGESFVAKWEKGNRPYGLRLFTPENYQQRRTSPLLTEDWHTLASGRALLFVHGTFSTAHGGFGEIPMQVIEELFECYEGRVFAFNHFTLSHDPAQNADWFLKQIPDEVALRMDIISHSRGGLVARSLVDALAESSQAHRVDRVLFVGVPNNGTLLAQPGHMIDFINRYTALLSCLPSGFLTESFEVIVMLAKALAHGTLKKLAGLAAMSPQGEFLSRLNSSERRATETTFYAVTADFEPKRSGITGMIKRVSLDRALDAIFREAPNDLVVPSAGVYEENGNPNFPIPEARRLRFKPDLGVHHCSYFPADLTSERLMAWLSPTAERKTPASVTLRKVALVIGNGAYQKRPLLRNPANDARALTNLLTELNFEVVTEIDAGRLAMHRAIRKYLEALRRAECGLLFFAGHGIQVHGENFMIPINAGLDDEDETSVEAIRLDDVLASLERTSCEANIVLLDCCRQSPYRCSTRSGAGGLAQVRAEGNLLVAYATGPGRIALDGKGEHSPFTEALLENLRRPGIEAVELIRDVTASVYHATGKRQRPWYGGTLIGRVYLGSSPDEPRPLPEPEKTEADSNTSSWSRRTEIYRERLTKAFAKTIDLSCLGQSLTLPDQLVEDLMRRGYVDDELVHWSQGRPQMAISWVGLLLDQCEGPLREILERLDREEAVDVFPVEGVVQSMLDNKSQAARDTANQWLAEHGENCVGNETGLAIVCALKRLIGLPTEAEELLRQIESTAEDPVSQMLMARTWLRILDQSEEASRCFQKALAADDPIANAEGYHEVLEDAAKGREALEEAAASAEPELYQFAISIPGAWLRYLGEEDRAQKSLEQAQQLVENCYDWHTCAQGWKTFFNDDQRAQQCLEKADTHSRASNDPDELQSCAQAWMDYLNAQDCAKACIEQAEKLASDCPAWIASGHCWFSIMNDCERAESALKSGVSSAVSASNWCECAELAVYLDLSELAKGYLNQAAHAEDEDITVWVFIARVWGMLEMPTKAREAMAEFEAVASTTGHWIEAANGHQFTLEQSGEAARCLRRAEKAAEAVEELIECACSWQILAQDTKAARRCLQAADELAESKEERSAIAEARDIWGWC